MTRLIAIALLLPFGLCAHRPEDPTYRLDVITVSEPKADPEADLQAAADALRSCVAQGGLRVEPMDFRNPAEGDAVTYRFKCIARTAERAPARAPVPSP